MAVGNTLCAQVDGKRLTYEPSPRNVETSTVGGLVRGQTGG
jgi:hypothetical protein